MKTKFILKKGLLSILIFSMIFTVNNFMISSVKAETWSSEVYLHNGMYLGLTSRYNTGSIGFQQVYIGSITPKKPIQLTGIGIYYQNMPESGRANPTVSYLNSILQPNGTYSLYYSFTHTYTPADVYSGFLNNFNTSGTSYSTDNQYLVFTPATSPTMAIYLYYKYLTNADPTITLASPVNNQILSDISGFNSFNIAGTTLDSDIGNTLTLKYQIDSNTPQVIQTLSANGSSQSFGPSNVTVTPSLSAGSHTLKVWSEDNNGGISIVPTRTFVVDRTPPTIPSIPIQNSVTETSSTFSWTASTDASGVAGYDVYRGATLIGSTTGATTFTANGLTVNTTYAFTVKAKDVLGNISAASNPLSVTTPDTSAPTNPSNLTIVSNTDNSANFSWTSSTDIVGVTGYDFYKDSALFGSTASNTFSVTGLLADFNYNFVVKAKDAAGNTSFASNASNLFILNSTVNDDTSTTANSMTYNTRFSSYITSLTDVDFYKYNAVSTGVDRIILNVPSGKNYDAYIYDANMTPIAAGIKGTGLSEDIIFGVTSGNTYYIKVFGVNGDFDIANYALTLSKYVVKYQTDYEYDSNGNLKRKTTAIIQP